MSELTFSAAAYGAAHAAVRDLLDAQTGAAFLRLKDAGGGVLATLPLQKPCGAVDPATGRLTLFPAAEAQTASESGQAASGELCDGAGAVHASLPVTQGTAAVSGFVVLDNLTLLAGGPVALVSAEIGG